MAILDPVIIGDAELWNGDCLEVMARMPENSIAAIVCDPPYLLNFMGKAFDKQHKSLPGANEGQKMQAWHARWVKEAFRILKPGGYLAAFGGDRTHHRLLVAMEDAGFELRQNCYWAFGAGFPKSQNAGKALDRKAGAKRDVVGKYMAPRQSERGIFRDEWPAGSYEQHGKIAAPPTTTHITAPATEAARKWEGFGSALKPAVEPICVGRKPMIGTLAENLLEWGTGAINIDGCRIGTEERTYKGSGAQPHKLNAHGKGDTGIGYMDGSGKDLEFTATGRYPAHLLHDNSPEVVAMFPVTTSGKLLPSHNAKPSTGWSGGSREGRIHNEFGGDSGSAARFFQSCPYDADDHNPLYYSGKASQHDRTEGTTKNNHISVKNTSLMRWLVRLFLPPGETVLDPFMGSGSTLKAALLENKTCIGIEMDPEYFAIAVERIKHVSPDGFSLESPT